MRSFLALRSYLPADHPDKAKEMGSEATPGAFLDALLDVVEACDRVLAPHGSLVFELGDTYSGSTADGGDNRGNDRYPVGRSFVKTNRDTSTGWPLDKSKVLVPQLFAIALAYGFNPLTGRTTPQWRVRNTVAWCRPNPPVGRDGDKFRPATSFLTVACKARDRYWDGDAVRVPHAEVLANGQASPRAKYPGHQMPAERDGRVATDHRAGGGFSTPPNPAGAPLLDYWVIPTEPFRGAHYATFPRALVVPLVKSMCPRKVCRVCGEPSRRIVESERHQVRPNHRVPSMTARSDDPGFLSAGFSTYETLGWSDCGHDSWRPGLIVDPFCGSGVTLAVASGHGLDSIGIELDSRNVTLAEQRIGGLFLTVEYLNGQQQDDAPSDPLLAQGTEGEA